MIKKEKKIKIKRYRGDVRHKNTRRDVNMLNVDLTSSQSYGCRSRALLAFMAVYLAVAQVFV